MSYQYIFDPNTNQNISLTSRQGRRCLEKYLQHSGGICSGYKSLTPLTNQDCPEGCRVIHYPRRGKKKPEYWFCNQFKPKPKYEIRVEPMELRPRLNNHNPAPSQSLTPNKTGNCRGMKSSELLTDQDCQAKGKHCRAVHQIVTKGSQKGTEYWYCNSYQRTKKVRFEMTPEERQSRLVIDRTNLLETNRTLTNLPKPDN